MYWRKYLLETLHCFSWQWCTLPRLSGYPRSGPLTTLCPTTPPSWPRRSGIITFYSWYILSCFSRGQGGILRRGRSTRWPRGRGKLRRRSGGWCGSGQVVYFYQLYFFSAIILLVSVCVLLGVLVLGVLRLRASHNRQLREEQEVEMVSRELTNYQKGGSKIQNSEKCPILYVLKRNNSVWIIY